MLKGKGEIVYTILKILLYAIGCWEYVDYHYHSLTLQLITAVVLITNNLFRQYYINKKENLKRLGRLSLIFDYVLGVYIAWLQPVFPVILLMTPTVIESVLFYSLSFGIVTTSATLGAMMAIDIIYARMVVDYLRLFRNLFVSYGLGYILIFIVSYLASLQFRERERLERANRELEAAYRKLLENASKLQELSVERERNRMAREIHDTLAHTLTAVIVQLEACKKLLDVDTARTRTEIGKAQQLTRDGLDDVKRSVKALRPQMLEDSSLKDALTNLIRDVEERTDVRINYSEDSELEACLCSSVKVALFRMIQESVTNAIRHGGAKRIDIVLAVREGALSVRISDTGRGCAHIKEGYGLKGIAERIKELGGTVRFCSEAGAGFHTSAVIPNIEVLDSDD